METVLAFWFARLSVSLLRRFAQTGHSHTHHYQDCKTLESSARPVRHVPVVCGCQIADEYYSQMLLRLVNTPQ